MKRALIILVSAMFAAGLSFARPVAARTVSYGFGNGYYGFNGSFGDLDNGGPFTNFLSLSSEAGNPSPCLKIKGIRGVGIQVTRQGFTGNFKALGFHRLSMDIKITQWYPTEGQPVPAARIFILPADGMSPWVRTAHGFSPQKGIWQHIWVDFNPEWTDTQAHAAGWQVVVQQGLPSKSFKQTTADAYATGLWLRVHNAGYENHVLIDNYRLEGSGPIVPLKFKSLKPALKNRIKPGMIQKQ